MKMCRSNTNLSQSRMHPSSISLEAHNSPNPVLNQLVRLQPSRSQCHYSGTHKSLLGLPRPVTAKCSCWRRIVSLVAIPCTGCITANHGKLSMRSVPSTCIVSISDITYKKSCTWTWPIARSKASFNVKTISPTVREKSPLNASLYEKFM